jgi:integrase/recombinase XerD
VSFLEYYLYLKILILIEGNIMGMINLKDGLKTIDEVFEEFQHFNKIRDLSEWTIISYNDSYKIFKEYYSTDNLCNSIDLQVVNDFIYYMKENRNVNNVSVNTHLTNMKSFVNYCIRLGHIGKPFKITMLKEDRKIKETYTDSELIVLLKKPNIKKCNFSEYRNWVFINYLLATGNRVSTVINIKIGDIDFDSDTIILKKTKNRNQQIIPISSSLKIVLLEYLKYRKGTAEDYLFCNARGKKMTVDCIKPSIRKYNRARGVTKTSIHLFRHTFAKNWILNGRRYFQITKTTRT